MSILVPVLAVAFVAFCVWLAVRIVNRSERWAKRLAVALVVSSPLLYVASLGPACWAVGDLADANEKTINAIPVIYYPILRLARYLRPQVGPGQYELSRLDRWIGWYATLLRRDGASPGQLSTGEGVWFVPPDDPPPDEPQPDGSPP
ncbi:MAG: hypothetical protein HY290_21405 [Planctomycetia bacterium]|nr:hypothetical protein [Planctomycetia bacterium]